MHGNDSMNKKRPRVRQHEIDILGQRLFEGLLDADWLLNPPAAGQDYGKDYSAELFEDGFQTEFAFHVQLKSQEKSIFGEPFVSKSLDAATVAHFVDDLPVPVFLIVASLQDQACYYQWIQNYVASLPDSWRSQKTITIRVPTNHKVNDGQAFRKYVKAACDHESSPHHAVERRRRLLEKIEPRIRVDIADTPEGAQFNFSAREKSFNLSLTFDRNADAKAKLSNFYSHGEPAVFPAGTVRIEGSPLFERFGNAPEIKIAKEGLPGASVTFSCAEHEVLFVGRFSASDRYVRFEGQTPEKCLGISLVLPPWKGEGNPSFSEFKLKLKTNFASFEGRDIRAVPYLEEFDAMFGFATVEETSVSASLSGQRVFAGSFEKNFSANTMLPSLLHIHFWAMIKRLARNWNAKIAYQSNPSVRDVNEAVAWCNLTTEKDNKSATWTMEVTMDFDEMPSFVPKANDKSNIAPLVEIFHSAEPVKLFNANVQRPGFSSRMTHVKVSPSRSKLESLMRKSPGPWTCRFKFESTVGSTFEYEQHN